LQTGLPGASARSGHTHAPGATAASVRQVTSNGVERDACEQEKTVGMRQESQNETRQSEPNKTVRTRQDSPQYTATPRWYNTCKAVGGRNYFTEMCSGSETGSYLRLIDFVYHSTLGVRVIKKKMKE